jgi:RNA polymerase sigma-70 factor (ECF subfamily)
LKTNKIYTDLELIKGCEHNDRYCQEMLYRKYFGSCIAYCKKYTTNEDELLEIINLGYLRVFQKASLFRNEGSLEGWIKKIMFHSLSDYFKKKNAYKTVEWEDSYDKPLNPSVLSALYEHDILTLLDQIPKSTAHVFELYILEGFSHDDISKKLGISIGTSKWHLSEAKKKLRILIENQENKNKHVLQYTTA